MNLPDAPIAERGFFAAHFFTVKDQEKSRDFYVRILGGKLIKPAGNAGTGKCGDRRDVTQFLERYHRPIVRGPRFCFDELNRAVF